jgi:hypothetical protein
VLIVDSHVILNVLGIWGGIGRGIRILEVVGLAVLGTELLKFFVHVDKVGWSPTILGKMPFTTTFVTRALKWFRLKVPRLKLLLVGPRGVSPSVGVSPRIVSMCLTFAIGSHLSCHVGGMRFSIRTSRRPPRGLNCMYFHLYFFDCCRLCGSTMNLPRWSRLGVLQQQLLMLFSQQELRHQCGVLFELHIAVLL